MMKARNLFTAVFFVTFLASTLSSPISPLSREFGVSDDIQVITVNGSQVCQVDGELYQPDDDLPTKNACEYCTCKPPGFACQIIKCEHKPGCRSLQRSGLCCPEYICDCKLNGKVYHNGDRIKDHLDPCEDCYCITGDITCSIIECSSPSNHCIAIPVEGKCCPTYNCTFETVQDATETIVDDETTDSPTGEVAVDTDDSQSGYLEFKEVTTTGPIHDIKQVDVDETTKGEEENLLISEGYTELPDVQHDTEILEQEKQVTTEENSLIQNDEPESITIGIREDVTERFPADVSLIELTERTDVAITAVTERSNMPTEEEVTTIPAINLEKSEEVYWTSLLRENTNNDQENPPPTVESVDLKTLEKNTETTDSNNQEVEETEATTAVNENIQTVSTADLKPSDEILRVSETLGEKESATGKEVETTTDSIIYEKSVTTKNTDLEDEKNEGTLTSEVDESDVSNLNKLYKEEQLTTEFPIQDDIETTELNTLHDVPEVADELFRSDIEELKEKLIIKQKEEREPQINEESMLTMNDESVGGYETTTQVLISEFNSGHKEDDSSSTFTSNPLYEDYLGELTRLDATEIPTTQASEENRTKTDYWIDMREDQSNPTDVLQETGTKKDILNEQEISLKNEETATDYAAVEDTTNLYLRSDLQFSEDVTSTEALRTDEQSTTEAVNEEFVAIEVTTVSPIEILISATQPRQSEDEELAKDKEFTLNESQLETTAVNEAEIITEAPGEKEFRLESKNLADNEENIEFSDIETITQITTDDQTTEFPETEPEAVAVINDKDNEQVSSGNRGNVIDEVDVSETQDLTKDISVVESETEGSVSDLEEENKSQNETAADTKMNETNKSSKPEVTLDHPSEISTKTEIKEVIGTDDDSTFEQRQNNVNIFDKIMNKDPVKDETPELEKSEKNTRLEHQFAHLARKYGLRPLTRRTFRENAKQRRQNRSRNRKSLFKQ